MTEKDLSKYRKCVAIDFGASSYARNAPGVPVEEIIINIPIKGELRELEEKDHPSPDLIPEEAIGKLIGEDLAIFPTGRGLNEEMRAHWIAERGEWIGIIYSHWLESDAWGDDHMARGPYVLDDYYARRIGALFEIYFRRNRKDISPQQILYTSPAKLKKKEVN